MLASWWKGGGLEWGGMGFAGGGWELGPMIDRRKVCLDDRDENALDDEWK